jgi:hypothetical protein
MGSDVVLKQLRDEFRGEATKVSVGPDSLGGPFVPLATPAETARDSLADKFELGFLIHQPPLKYSPLLYAVSQ